MGPENRISLRLICRHPMYSIVAYKRTAVWEVSAAEATERELFRVAAHMSETPRTPERDALGIAGASGDDRARRRTVAAAVAHGQPDRMTHDRSSGT